ncbi:MAG: hypothetical protein OK457_10465 [Thaumarchaeota archaeon]|nr:hypothetical protein [Nitrososphaerota archaeon]
MSSSTAVDIAQRAKFYNEPDVMRAISRDGVPKSRGAMNLLISEGTAGKSSSGVTPQLVDCLGFVVYSVHPQQINIRDKANGKIIVVIAR